MAKRKGISKKIRFEVFKRDSFTCQYCGEAAPTVALRVDHIHPVSKDGDNDILNLITACFECNAGKSDRLLSDDSAIQKQKAQLDELNERREQLEMMIQWRDGIKNLSEREVDAAELEWVNLSGGYSPTETGTHELRKLIKKFGLAAVLDAMSKTVKYFTVDPDGGFDSDSVQLGWSKIGGICQIATFPEWKQQLIHVRNIARSRAGGWWHGSTSADVLRLLQEAYELGHTIESLKDIALQGHSYTRICQILQGYIVEDES